MIEAQQCQQHRGITMFTMGSHPLPLPGKTHPPTQSMSESQSFRGQSHCCRLRRCVGGSAGDHALPVAGAPASQPDPPAASPQAASPPVTNPRLCMGCLCSRGCRLPHDPAAACRPCPTHRTGLLPVIRARAALFKISFLQV